MIIKMRLSRYCVEFVFIETQIIVKCVFQKIATS